MAQNITLTIGGKPYKLVAPNPDSERNMRVAAEEINKTLAKFSEQYPTASETDKLIFTSLTLTVSKLQTMEASRMARSEVDDLCKRLDNYLDGKEI